MNEVRTLASPDQPQVGRVTPCAPPSATGQTIYDAVPTLRRAQSVAPYLLVALSAILLCSCAGYKLGPTNGQLAREKSIQVGAFVNHTTEPRLTEAVIAQLRKELQNDGTYQLATHDEGDIVVSGTITGYNRHELSFLPTDVLTVRDYRVSLTAHVTAKDRSSGKLLLDQPVTGYTIIRVGSDLTSTERQALPLLAADLAKNVTARLVDGSW